jgi:hypothetical protein
MLRDAAFATVIFRHASDPAANSRSSRHANRGASARETTTPVESERT